MPGDIESLLSDTGEFLESRGQLLKLKAADKATDIASSLVSKITIAAVIVIFITTVNIGLALVLGEWLGKSYYGFFIVAGFYALAGLVLYVFRTKWLKMPLQNSMVSKIFNSQS